MDSKQVIVTLVNALKVDYGQQFNRAYATEEEVIIFKKRCWMAFKPFNSECILEAYDSLTKESPQYMPNLQLIISRVKSTHNKREREDEQLAISEKQAALPPPTHYVNSIQLLAEAKEATDNKGEPTQADRDDAMLKHDIIIANYTKQGFIRKPPNNNDSQCVVGRCNKSGALTDSLKGSDRWYCANHWQVS